MANPLLKRLLGEAVEDDPVEHHLATVGAGVPPVGRTYPSMSPPQLSAGHATEEKREVKIGREMMEAINLLPPIVQKDVSIRKLSELAQELIDMHTSKPPA